MSEMTKGLRSVVRRFFFCTNKGCRKPKGQTLTCAAQYDSEIPEFCFKSRTPNGSSAELGEDVGGIDWPRRLASANSAIMT